MKRVLPVPRQHRVRLARSGRGVSLRKTPRSYLGHLSSWVGSSSPWSDTAADTCAVAVAEPGAPAQKPSDEIVEPGARQVLETETGAVRGTAIGEMHRIRRAWTSVFPDTMVGDILVSCISLLARLDCRRRGFSFPFDNFEGVEAWARISYRRS